MSVEIREKAEEKKWMCKKKSNMVKSRTEK